MDQPVSPSLAESGPPPRLSAQRMSREGLQASEHLHPLWRKSRGDGVGDGDSSVGSAAPARGRCGKKDKEPAAPSRFQRISLAALEAEQQADGDGADSTIDSEDDDLALGRARPPRGATSSPPHADEDDEDDEDDEEDDDDDEEVDYDDDDDDDGEEGGGVHGAKKKRRKRAHKASAAQDGSRERAARLNGMAAAAFGNPALAADASSVASETSSRRRADARRAAFPVRGVTCVGCSLANRIQPVERFVEDQLGKMADDSLFKMAALVYKRDVADVVEREGGVAPPWKWKEVRSHFTFHVSTNTFARHRMATQLQTMRSQLETQMLRVEADGAREICRHTADLFVKVCAAESKERLLLDAARKRGRED